MDLGVDSKANVFQSTLASMYTPVAIAQFLHHTLGLKTDFLGHCLLPAHSLLWFFNLHKKLWAGLGYALHEEL